jgi:hypothetical protein
VHPRSTATQLLAAAGFSGRPRYIDKRFDRATHTIAALPILMARSRGYTYCAGECRATWKSCSPVRSPVEEHLSVTSLIAALAVRQVFNTRSKSSEHFDATDRAQLAFVSTEPDQLGARWSSRCGSEAYDVNRRCTPLGAVDDPACRVHHGHNSIHYIPSRRTHLHEQIFQVRSHFSLGDWLGRPRGDQHRLAVWNRRPEPEPQRRLARALHEFH